MRITRRNGLNVILTVCAVFDLLLAISIFDDTFYGVVSYIKLWILTVVFGIGAVCFSLLNPRPYDPDVDK